MNAVCMYLQFQSTFPESKLTAIGKELVYLGGIHGPRGSRPYGCTVIITNIFNSELDYVFRWLERHGIGGLIRHKAEPIRFWSPEQSPSDEWLALHLGAGDIQLDENPIENYEVYLPGLPAQPGKPATASHGYLLPGRPVIMREKPKGRVSFVDRDMIFETRFLEVLGGDDAGAWNGDVFWRGKQMKSWRRLLPHRRCSIISAESFLPEMACVACGQETLLPAGFWIAKEGAAFNDRFAMDEIGYRCKRRGHPFVVSVEHAVELNRCFRGHGYTLEPIFYRDSRTAQMVFDVIRRAGSLIDRNPPPNIDTAG